eukprot:Lithocolla_globosa_v1_NODE_25_length_9285_cov_133.641170.p4 type:complete len:180 gc:universal NODE_25_length_9285_cov_133.641170:5350-4811(-)
MSAKLAEDIFSFCVDNKVQLKHILPRTEFTEKQRIVYLKNKFEEAKKLHRDNQQIDKAKLKVKELKSDIRRLYALYPRLVQIPLQLGNFDNDRLFQLSALKKELARCQAHHNRHRHDSIKEHIVDKEFRKFEEEFGTKLTELQQMVPIHPIVIGARQDNDDSDDDGDDASSVRTLPMET